MPCLIPISWSGEECNPKDLITSLDRAPVLQCSTFESTTMSIDGTKARMPPAARPTTSFSPASPAPVAIGRRRRRRPAVLGMPSRGPRAGGGARAEYHCEPTTCSLAYISGSLTRAVVVNDKWLVTDHMLFSVSIPVRHSFLPVRYGQEIVDITRFGLTRSLHDFGVIM